jgi:hypothetical protein
LGAAVSWGVAASATVSTIPKNVSPNPRSRQRSRTLSGRIANHPSSRASA